MPEDTVTIRAEMIDDLSAETARMRAQIGSLGESVRAANMQGAAFSRGMSDMEAMGRRLGSSLDSLISRIGQGIETAARRGVTALGLLAAGAEGVGLKFTAAMQTSRLALDTFMGSAQAGGQVMAQLQQLIGPASIGQLTQGFQFLATSGGSAQSITTMMRALANISAVQVDPGSAFDALSQAVNRIQSTQQLEPRSLLAFLQNGVDVYGMLSGEMGIPRDQVRKQIEQMNRSGGTMTAPANFLGDLSALNGPLAKFQGGLEAYRKTLPGIWSQIKAVAGQAISTMTTPLTDWLAKTGQQVEGWLRGVQQRATELGPALGRELGAGDMAGFSGTLATILGNPQLAGTIKPIAEGIRNLGLVFKNDIIPIGRDLLRLAVPALEALDSVLGVMAAHRSLTEGLLVTLGGFLALYKVSSVITGIAGSVLSLRNAVGEGGWIQALLGLLRGTTGAGGGGGGGIAGKGGGGGPVVVGGGGLGETAGTLLSAAVIGGGIYSVGKNLLSHHANWGDVIHNAIGGAAVGGTVGLVGGVSAVPAAAIGALVGGGSTLLKMAFAHHKAAAPAGGGAMTMTFQSGSIVVNGAGDPKATAQQVPQAIADAIEAYNRQQQQRGGPTWP